jgi:hypothetical protein
MMLIEANKIKQVLDDYLYGDNGTMLTDVLATIDSLTDTEDPVLEALNQVLVGRSIRELQAHRKLRLAGE